MKQIEDIKSLLDAMSNRGAEMKAFEGLLGEISTALADLVSLLEQDIKADKAVAKAMDPKVLVESFAKALALGLAEAMGKLPQPTLTMPEIKMPTFELPAPVTTAVEPWKALKVTINRDEYGGGPMRGFTVTRA